MIPLARVVDRAGALQAERPAVADINGARFSYGELARRAAKLAGALHARGIAPGDRVAILARNSFRYLEINLACAYAGVILVPLNIRLAPAEVARILAVTETRLLFQALPYDGNVPVLTWDDAELPGAGTAYEQFLAGAAPLPHAVESKPTDIAQIFFTSGTTGEPKGVCLTHENLAASAIDSIIALELNADDVWFHAPPMFHLVDAFAIWAVSMVGGLHVLAHFEPAQFGPMVQAERVTKTSLPPVLLDLIARDRKIGSYDLTSLERISYGGAPMPDAMYARVTETLGCPLVQAYGITETSGLVCQQFPRDLDPPGTARRNSVGQPALSIELKVIGDDGNTLPPGEIGEMAVRGPRVMREYWRNPEATRAAMPDGWFRTGDLGVADAHGHYSVVGRKKDMIISGAENVYPTEVENALCTHPAVAEAAVIGVPSARWGEEVRGIVFLNPGFAVTPEELMAHCRGLIGGYKIPKAIDISPVPLPKSGPGKIAKTLLRAPFWEKAT